VDEFTRAKLTKEPATLMNVSMVAESPVKYECEYFTTLRLPGNPPMGTVDVVIGRVIAVHIKDEVLTDRKLDIREMQPIARCGYYEYTVVKETIDMVIPGMSEDVLYELEGSAKHNREVQSRDEKEKENEGGQ
jgi:flavin reductase (DIM6/NTAB) family NADH-FMN oxidoreductase RutF